MRKLIALTLALAAITPTTASALSSHFHLGAFCSHSHEKYYAAHGYKCTHRDSHGMYHLSH